MIALRLSPSISITLGLVSLTMLMFFLLDRVVGVVPDDHAQAREIREQVSTNLALQLGALIQSGNDRLLEETLLGVQNRSEDIISLAVRQKNGELLAQSGHHQKFWSAPPDGKSTLTHVQIPVYLRNEKWGSIEISFRSLVSGGLLAFMKSPSVALPASILFFGSFLYYLYLRRVLNHLDPTQVIPNRVNTALDTLTEGVMIVDNQDNILLVNEGFKKLHPGAQTVMLGSKITQLKWLNLPVIQQLSMLPWKYVLTEEKALHQILVKIPQDDHDVRVVSLNAAPVRDSQGKVRGCLVTFSDVTEREKMNQKLRRTLRRLQDSQDKIEKQNKALQHLANYDQLTGIYNRRAFFEYGEQQLQLCVQTHIPLVCIMCDIDHFKRINDNYGHPVGDSAITVVTGQISRNIRQNDVLGRYGGEEFCVVLPGISRLKGIEIAERMRTSIEKNAGKGVRSVDGLKITSSFGMTLLTSPRQTLSELIELADQALYLSKESGRNCISVFTANDEAPENVSAGARSGRFDDTCSGSHVSEGHDFKD